MTSAITIEDYSQEYLLTSYGISCVLVHIISHALFASPKAGKTKHEITVNRHRYANKIVGMCHAAFLSFVAVRCGLLRGFDFDGNQLLEKPPLEHFAVGCMMAYLVYDTIFFVWRVLLLQPLLLGIKEPWTFGDHTLTIAHHVLGLWSWYLIYSGTGGVYWAQFIHVAELSTPILNLRWILLKEGVTSGPLYLGISAAFVILFFFSRIPTSSYLVYKMILALDKWPSPAIGYFQLFVTSCFFLINMSWMAGIVKMAQRALKGDKKKKKTKEIKRI